MLNVKHLSVFMPLLPQRKNNRDLVFFLEMFMFFPTDIQEEITVALLKLLDISV